MDYNSSHLLHEGKLSDGNPALGIPASLDRAEHMNAVTDELRNIILGGGLIPDKNILNQAQLSIVAQIQAAINNVIAAAPGVLNTLDELAASLGDDPNFATTITALIAAKVSVADIVDALNSTATNKPLSAAQGKVLNDAIALRVLTSAIVNNLTSTASNVPLSAAQGKVLNDAIALRVLTTSIVNVLTSTATNVPLSAAQGKVLKDLIDSKLTVVSKGSNANGHYRLWSDGFIEQWGYNSTNLAGNDQATLPFAVSFTDLTSVNFSALGETLAAIDGMTLNYRNLTLNSAIVNMGYGDGVIQGIMWRAKGY